jgi:hypothetical protein
VFRCADENGEQRLGMVNFIVKSEVFLSVIHRLSKAWKQLVDSDSGPVEQ